MRLSLLFLAWTGFCALHSALISVSFKAWAKRRLGRAFRFHRLAYNLVSLATFLAVLAYASSLREAPFFVWEGRLLPVKFGMLALAALGFALGGRHYRMAQFAGWAQIFEKPGGGAMGSTGTLSTQGILGLVRHPWYAATFPLLWASDLDRARLIGNSVLTAYLVIGTWLEERKLVLEFGEAYRDYQRRVSMFFPWKWLKARVARFW